MTITDSPFWKNHSREIRDWATQVSAQTLWEVQSLEQPLIVFGLGLHGVREKGEKPWPLVHLICGLHYLTALPQAALVPLPWLATTQTVSVEQPLACVVLHFLRRSPPKPLSLPTVVF